MKCGNVASHNASSTGNANEQYGVPTTTTREFCTYEELTVAGSNLNGAHSRGNWSTRLSPHEDKHRQHRHHHRALDKVIGQLLSRISVLSKLPQLPQLPPTWWIYNEFDAPGIMHMCRLQRMHMNTRE
jgi:hypothetical protein